MIDSMILGIDEVGRGPWAGPLVVGAVVLPGDFAVEGLTDSKKLSVKNRIKIDELVRSNALSWGLGWVHADEIDQIGLGESLKLATIRAVDSIKTPYHQIIIDGTINFLKDTSKGRFVTTLKKADLLIPAVSAASVVAKVARDNFMINQASLYPGYGFESHVGYGTAAHQRAIMELGVTPLHRLSFAPLKQYQTQPQGNVVIPKVPSTTKQIGDQAESKVCEYLATLGHVVIERNWKTKYCEIDIVSKYNGSYYFTEVKYRSNPEYGDGLAVITAKKIKQMRFGVELFLHSNKLKNVNPIIQVASVTGRDFAIDHLIDVSVDNN